MIRFDACRFDSYLFDAYLFVDWSARSVPGPGRPAPDSLWVGQGEWTPDGSLRTRESYWSTREACAASVREQLLEWTRCGLRVLAGFDFPYGYPTGWADLLDPGSSVPPWRRVWDAFAAEVRDGPDNRNTRFEAASALNRRCGAGAGPLWGCPAARQSPHLSSRSPRFPFVPRAGAALERLRWTDRAALRRRSGLQEGWKLYGSGSVGSQALTGIPRLRALRDDPALAPVSRVWPFETGFTSHPAPDHGPFILHAEIWPGLVRARLDPSLPIRDQAQVRALVQWAAEADRARTLPRCFDRPAALPPEALPACADEEGWILGA